MSSTRNQNLNSIVDLTKDIPEEFKLNCIVSLVTNNITEFTYEQLNRLSDLTSFELMDREERLSDD